MQPKAVYSIILVDDHEVFRLGLKTLISGDSSLKVVGEAENGNKLLNLLEMVACDLIILDLWMPEMNGLLLLDKLNEQYPNVKRLILSMDISHETLRKVLAKGIDGYIHKEAIADSVVTAIHQIRNSKKFFADEIKDFILGNYDSLLDNQNELKNLTAREKEVTGMIASGLINKEVASILNISNYTVQFHRSNAMRKLGLKNTAELVQFAVKHDLQTPN
jgi:DNA-binding NarL/FixJ family response regulator